MLKVSGRLLARNTVFNIAGQAIPALVAMVAIPATIHRMGAERFGLIGLAWVVLGYFSYLDLGMGYAATRLVSEALGRGDTRRVPPIVGSAVAVQACTGLLGAIAVYFAAPLIADRLLRLDPALRDDAVRTFRILAAAISIVMISASLRSVLAAGQRFALVNAVTIPASMLNFLIPLAGALGGWSLARIALLLVAARVAVLVTFLLLAARAVPGLIRNSLPTRPLIRELLGFGLWASISNVLAPVFGSLDRFLLGGFRNVAAVGFYTPPQELVLRLSILPGSLVATLFPALTSLGARNETGRMQDLYGRSIRFLTLSVGAVALVLVALGPDLLRLWLGEEFATQAGGALQFLAAGIVVNAIAYVPSAYLHSVNRPDLPALMHVVELPVFLGLAWLLMRPYGVVGAGAVWFLRTTLDTTLLLVFSARTGMRVRMGTTATVLILTFGAAALIAHLVPGVASRVLLALLLLAGFLWAGWGRLLSTDDRRNLTTLFQRRVA